MSSEEADRELADRDIADRFIGRDIAGRDLTGRDIADADLANRGAAIADRLIRRVEALQTGVAECLINAVARKHRVSPYHLAVRVPGVCHEHSPTTRPVDGCAYCRRRGNVLADGG